MEKEYEEWLAISSGQSAPEVTGVTSDGKTVSLSDLMGKVVYIDVWATWCGPCKAEFPYYKSIQKEFEQNNEIEFLFVSVDKDQEKWVNYLKDEYHPEGIQMIEQKDNPHPSIHESYKIWGIPRYI